MYIRGILGGNWDNSVNCGSRSSNWNNSPLNLNSNNSSRGVADTEGLCSTVAESNCPLADICSLLLRLVGLVAKHTAAAPLGLVGKPKALAGDIC